MYTYPLAPNRGRAAVYCRKSHWDEGVSLSVTTQATNGRRGGEVVGFTVGDMDIFTDDGISGMTDDRPGLRSMLLKVFSPERPYEAVIVTDLSRLSRSSGGYINYEDMFAEGGIQLISLMEPPSNPRVKIDTTRRMRAVMNETQVVDAALKTRDNQMVVVEMGFFIGWVRPFGYRKLKVMWNGKEHTKLEPHPDEWPHLIHIKEMAKNNHSLSQIRRHLEKTGLTHPAGEIDQRKNGKVGMRGKGAWTGENISYLLTKSMAVLGCTARGGEGSGTDILHKSEQMICRNAHEAAMSEEERELIVRNLASRKRDVKNPRTHGSPNPMSGLLVCGASGATMQLHTTNGIPRLVCANKRDYTKGEPKWCPNPAVRLDIFIERTLRALLGHILTSEALQKLIRTVVKLNKEYVEIQVSRQKQIKKRIKELESEIGNFGLAVAKYGPSNPFWGREADRREEETKLLQQELQLIDTELDKKLVFLNNPSRIMQNALSLRTPLESDDPHQVKEMIQSIIKRASILDRVVTLEYAVPLPKNGTPEPILFEKLGLDKKVVLP